MTIYQFPDVERALTEILDDLGVVTTWLEYGFEDQVTLDQAVIHLSADPGVQSFMFRTTPVSVTVYGEGRTAANRVAEQITSRLLSGPHDTEQGLIDTIDVSTLPVLNDYPHDRVNQVNAVYDVDTRPVF